MQLPNYAIIDLRITTPKDISKIMTTHTVIAKNGFLFAKRRTTAL